MAELDIGALRKAVEENRYLITHHAQQRMGLPKITHADIKHVVTSGAVVEQCPYNEPDLKTLFKAHQKVNPVCLLRL